MDIALIIRILPYSAIKIAANNTEAYSTLFPATSSASASIRSNGVRFVSASDVMTNNNQIGHNGSIYQICNWLCTISGTEKEPDISITDANTVPIQISYEIICEAARTPPRNAYLELLAQPEKITVCTLTVPSIITNSNKYCNSTTTKTLVTGITNHKPNIRKNDSSGAAINIKTLELEV